MSREQGCNMQHGFADPFGSGSGRGDPVDVDHGWHSRLIYLWEIAVNDRYSQQFSTIEDTSQRQTEVKMTCTTRTFWICSSPH